MPTGRIDIRGQDRACETEVKVSRTMPAALTDRMRHSQWTSFCDRIDEALVPAAKAKMCNLVFMILFVSLTIGMMIFSFVSFSNASSSFDSSPASSFAPMFVAFAVLFVGVVGMMCWAASVSRRVEGELRKVCEDESAARSGISFHVREERYLTSTYNHHSDTGMYGNRGYNLRSAKLYWIEVSVSSVAATLPVAQGYVAPSAPYVVAPSAPAVVVPEPKYDVESGGKRTPAERMEDLDQMKGLLTEDEYQQKRAEILSDV